jgi:hypothetical protein
MSKKDKTSEINDIIDSSYTEADYSYNNEYYDEVDSHRRRNTSHNGGGGGGSGSSNPFSKISSVRASPASVSTPTLHTNASNATNATNATSATNIFMKYTGNAGNNNTNTTGDKSIAIPKEIKNTEDDFPSLGGCKKPTILATPAPMNFKKIVETKKPVEVQQQVVQQKSRPKHDDYYNGFKVYEQVKYYSEKNAKSKIYSKTYSDDDEDDDEYDDE